MPVKAVAVIGAGLAGLVTARALQERCRVVVFEKSRGPGGRLATRYADAGEFDHGAQFFTARNQAFRRWLTPMIAAGTVMPWQAVFAELRGGRVHRTWAWTDKTPHYVAVPRMNALGKMLAGDVDLRRSTGVAGMTAADGGWQLLDDGGESLGVFDWVVFAVPAAQAFALLPHSTPLRDLAGDASMQPCYALMLGLSEPCDWPWQAARVLGQDISWISVNDSKPGRPESHSLVVHSTNAWAAEHLEAEPLAVRSHLLGEVLKIAGIRERSVIHQALHRWRYANAGKRETAASCVDTRRRLGICGDWLVHGRVEGAFTSAQNLIEALADHL